MAMMSNTYCFPSFSFPDTFDAMTSDRPYRKTLLKEEAFDELRRSCVTQFDKVLVGAFIKAFETRRI
jgi:HD-GYP domain-containing protein (c-di-GMP phosphodiesterase class II)